MLTIISAVLPAITTLLLGMFAAHLKDFSHENALVLNRLVLRYALPLMLFAGIIGSNLAEIKANLLTSSSIGITMVGSLFLIFAISYWILKRDLAVATLRALAITCPAITFVGPSILPAIYPHQAALIISVGGLFQNLIQVPFAMILLEKSSGEKGDLKQIIQKTVKEPIIWAPLLAFILVCFGFRLPDVWLHNFTVLGQATGGVALFASGITLYYKKLHLSTQVLINVFLRNILIPGVTFLALLYFQAPTQTINMATIAMAIPSASTPTILASQFGKQEQEIASTLFISTLFTIFSMGAFILWRGI